MTTDLDLITNILNPDNANAHKEENSFIRHVEKLGH